MVHPCSGMKCSCRKEWVGGGRWTHSDKEVSEINDHEKEGITQMGELYGMRTIS